MSARDSIPADAALFDWVEAFEAVRVQQGDVDLVDFLPAADHPLYHEVRRELIRVDLELGWHEPSRRRLEYYVGLFPDLLHDRMALADVAFEEFRLRLFAGECPQAEEYERRYGIDTQSWLPHLHHPSKTGWSSVAPGSSTDAPSTPDSEMLSPATWPEVGGKFLGFRLICELGRGSFGRVFLAKQEYLADRPVALKVTLKQMGEEQKLARLQHTNIMPVYSMHRAGPFQAVCMPFFGAATLADVLGAAADGASGQLFVAVLRRRQNERPFAGYRTEAEAAETPPALRALEKLNREETALWLGQCVAEGLAHAHERGIVHRDLKPANILLTDDAQPMLLDFNLSADKIVERLRVTVVGGTLAYMAPEHLDAMQGGRRPVDARSDLFALGVVLFELLCGRPPFPPRSGPVDEALPLMLVDRLGPPPALRPWNADISPALESLVQHCLEPDPARRYQSAQELVEDLRRQAQHRPLLYALEPSWRERLTKWVRRHPRLASPLSLAALTVIVLALLAAPLAWSAWTRANFEAQRAQESADLAQHEAKLAAQDARLAADRESLAVKAADLARKETALTREATLRAAEEALAEFRKLETEAVLWRRLLVLAMVLRLNPDEAPVLGTPIKNAVRQCLESKLSLLLDAPAGRFTEKLALLPELERSRLSMSVNGLRCALACLAALHQDKLVDVALMQVGLTQDGLERHLSRLRNPSAAADRHDYFAACAKLNEGQLSEAVGLLTSNPPSSPHHAEARFLLGMCHQKQGAYFTAQQCFDASVEGVRQVVGAAVIECLGDGHRQRGLRLARAGQRNGAAAEAELLIQFEPTPERYYQAASIYAASLEAQKDAPPKSPQSALAAFDKKRAFELLAYALRHGHGTDIVPGAPTDKIVYRFQADEALTPLRQLPEFARLAVGLEILGSGTPPRMRPFNELKLNEPSIEEPTSR